MREIKHIVIHCTATKQNATVDAIKNYWKNHLKWKDPGYHIIIDKKGETHYLQSLDKIANGVAGKNANAIHIAYIGGITDDFKPVDNRTLQQKASLLKHIIALLEAYPGVEILGHRDFPGVKKDCPCFNVKEWLKLFGI